MEFFQLFFKRPLSLPLDIQRTHQRIKLIKNVKMELPKKKGENNK